MKGERMAYVVGVDDLRLLGIEDVKVLVRMAGLCGMVYSYGMFVELLKSGHCVDSVVYITADNVDNGVVEGGSGGLGLVVLDSSYFRGDKSIDTVRYVGVGGDVGYWYVYNYEGLYYYLFRDIVGVVRYFDEGIECYEGCFGDYEAIDSYLSGLG